MKKLLLILLICTAFACKKSEVDGSDITRYSWPLVSATVNPAMVVNGKAETNFKTMAGPSGCLNNNYTLSFSKDGSYAFTSNGPLCDMISYQNSTWTKSGNEITLSDGLGHDTKVTLNGNSITQKYVFEQNGTTHTVTYLYTAKQ